MSFLLNPTIWLAALLMVLGSFGAGYWQGSRRAAAQCAADLASAQQAAQRVADTVSARRETVAAQRETSRERIRIVYQTLKEQAHELKNPPLPNPLPASGARGLDAAPLPNPLPASGARGLGSAPLSASGGGVFTLDCRLGADGLRLWNAANAGAAAPVRGEPDGGLPGTAPGEIGQADGFAGQPHRGDGVVQPVPGSGGQVAGVFE